MFRLERRGLGPTILRARCSREVGGFQIFNGVLNNFPIKLAAWAAEVPTRKASRPTYGCGGVSSEDAFPEKHVGAQCHQAGWPSATTNPGYYPVQPVTCC